MAKKCPFGQDTADFINRHKDAYGAFNTLSEISGKYRILILTHLEKGPARFAELQRLTTASRGSLARILNELVSEEILQRVTFPGNLPHVEYSLTTRGKELLPIIKQLSRYYQRYRH